MTHHYTSYNAAAARPLVAISRCLTGERVRYDGDHKGIENWQQMLATPLQLLPLCPEVEAGLGVPRPPVQLIAVNGGIAARGRDNHVLDVTGPLEEVAAKNIRQLKEKNAAGYIFQSRSPSCGVGTTPIHNRQGEPVELGDGLQAAAIKKALPYLAIIDDFAIVSAPQRNRFIHRCQLVSDALISVSEGTERALLAHYQQHNDAELLEVIREILNAIQDG